MLHLLLYRQKFKIREREPYEFLPKIGAKKDTIVEATNLEINSDLIVFGIIPKNEVTYMLNQTEDVRNICDLTIIRLPFQKQFARKSLNQSINFTVQENNLYIPIVIACDNSSIKGSLIASFKYENHYLDSRYTSLNYSTKVALLLPLGIVAIIVIKLICKKTFFNNFQVIVFGVTFVTLFSSVGWAILYEEMYLVGSLLSLKLFVVLGLNIILKGCIFAALYIAASGFLMHTSKISKLRLFLAVIYGFLSTPSYFFIDFIQLGEFSSVAFVVQFFAIISSAHLIFSAHHQTELSLLAFQLVVEAVGYAPETAPTRRKLNMHYFLLLSEYAYFFLLIGFVVASYLYSAPLYITVPGVYLLDTLLLLALSLYSTPSNILASDWWRMYEDVEALEDIPRRGLDYDGPPEERKTWVPRAKLPIPPLCVEPVLSRSIGLSINDTDNLEDDLLTDRAATL